MKGQETHGIYIGRMSRRHPHYDGYGTASASRAPERDKMFAEVHVVTDTFNFGATVELTPAEVNVINKLEARIAARLSDEVANKGVHGNGE